MMIETNTLEREKVAKTIEDVIAANADQVVLGCTHYHWIEQLIKNIAAGRVEVLQPEGPVIAQLKSMLSRLP